MSEARAVLKRVMETLKDGCEILPCGYMHGIITEVLHKPEECCEWVLRPGYFAFYQTACDRSLWIGLSWTFCPFCGRKIKVKT